MKKVILLLIVFSISICVLGCNNKNEYTNKIIHSGTQITKSNKNNSETQKNITTEISAEKTTINSSTKFDTTNDILPVLKTGRMSFCIFKLYLFGF